MSDKITKITAENKELLKNKSAYGIPDNPSNHGFSASQIKSKLADPSLILCDWLSRLANETSSGFDAYDEQIDETVREAAEVYFGSKADKVGPLPCYKVKTTDKVVDFIQQNNCNNVPIAIIIGSHPFVGLFDYSENGGTVNFELEELAHDNAGLRRYVGTEYYAATVTFNTLISNNSGFLHEYQDSKFLVKTISSSSNDYQYPTAKCVWNITQNIREVAEGKCKSIVIGYDLTIATVKTMLEEYESQSAYLYNPTTKKFDINITQDILNGDYDSYTGLNYAFNSQDNLVDLTEVSGTFLIMRSFEEDIFGWLLVRKSHFESFFKRGDVVLITQTDVPDRWFSIDSAFYKLETTKVDLTPFPAKAETETISGDWTFSSPITISGGDGFKLKTSGYDGIFALGLVNVLEFSSSSFWSNVNGYDLGKTGHEWRNFYISGNFNDGTYVFSVGQAYKILFGTYVANDSITELNYQIISKINKSADTTFTFVNAPNTTYPEYKAIITNSGSSSITLTFTGVSNILCNDDNCTITNATNSTLTLPAGVTIECSIMNGKMVAVNFAA